MSLELRKAQALRKRIPTHHPKYEAVDEKYRLLISGYNGEKSLDYYLKFFPDKKYTILNGLRLPDYSTNTFFEIDSLIVSPHFILDVDSKNHKGELHFDHRFEQMIQITDQSKKTYPCPLTQLFENNKIAVPPIESLVVITNPLTRISATDHHPGIKSIIRAPSLISKMELFEKKNKSVVLENKQIQKLIKLLKKLHTPLDKDILDTFGIMEKELLKGIFCPKCDALSIKRSQRKWCCINCGHTSTTAHIKAIIEYGLLVDRTITNKKLREFLLLPSRNIATNLLRSMGLAHFGNKKGRTYQIPVEDLIEMNEKESLDFIIKSAKKERG